MARSHRHRRDPHPHPRRRALRPAASSAAGEAVAPRAPGRRRRAARARARSRRPGVNRDAIGREVAFHQRRVDAFHAAVGRRFGAQQDTGLAPLGAAHRRVEADVLVGAVEEQPAAATWRSDDALLGTPGGAAERRPAGERWNCSRRSRARSSSTAEPESVKAAIRAALAAARLLDGSAWMVLWADDERLRAGDSHWGQSRVTVPGSRAGPRSGAEYTPRAPALRTRGCVRRDAKRLSIRPGLVAAALIHADLRNKTTSVRVLFQFRR